MRVLDISTVLAAPLCATLLADYGADVIKVELPGKGDGLRDFPPFKDGKSLWWKVANRNKRLITLDLRTPEGRGLFERLLPGFDVLVENFRPGTLDRWGLDATRLWTINPKLVILRATAFGQTGPYRDRPGFARLFEAMGGLTYLTGEKHGEPMHTGYPLGDAIGGLFAAVGVLAALYRRIGNPEAGGEEIDLSLTESLFRLLDFLPIEHDQLGVVRERAGNGNLYSAPAAVYLTRDGHHVSLAGSTNAIFANNARAIGRGDLITDERYATNRARVENSDDINAIFAGWMREHTLAEILAAFADHGGVIAPVHSIAQIVADPQMRAREAIVPVPDDDFGTVRMQNVVPRFVKSPGRVRGSAGAIGRDNMRVYREELGLSEDDLHALRQRKVI